jgi:zinc transport system ATP-binding protein
MAYKEELLHVKHVFYQVDRQSILEDISFVLAKGTILAIIGPNGAGKTTLVKIILGLLQPTTGAVDRKENMKSAYVPQKFLADPSLPLHVESFLRLTKAKISDVWQALENMQILHLRHVPLFNLSGGEWQKVLLARAFLRQPDFLVLDEPTQGVDSKTLHQFYGKIVEIRDTFMTGVVLVTHDLAWAFKIADRILFLNHTLIFEGEPNVAMKHESFLNLFPEHFHYA